MIFIAEIGLNHNGNFGLFHTLVREASEAGADIAKFQLGWRDSEGEINCITPEVLSNILDICDYYEIEPMVSILTPEAYEIAKHLNFRRYKIASRTVEDNPNLVESILSEGKETFVSLGFWSKPSLPFETRDNLRYLWCNSLYPTPPWALKGLPKTFIGTPYVGYSDHSIGIEAALLSITRGARVIEKHFTLDKSDVTTRDHALSATPTEFGQMVKLGRNLVRLLDLGV
jgi:sialic acid synthase SpsE